MKTTESELAPTGSAGLSRWLYIARLRWQEACRSYPNELGQIKVRLAYAVVLWGFVAAAGMAWGFDAPHVLWPMVVVAAGTAVAAGLLIHALVSLRNSELRKTLAIFHDIGFLSMFMILGEEITAPFFPIYLWVILGYGFRFGVKYLYRAAWLAILLFAVVVATTGFWREQILLAAGLLSSLIVLPLYVASLINRLHEAKAMAERANAAKGEFLATISHEVRTPLNAIIGLSDILRGSPLNGEQRQMIRSIGSAGRTLFDMMGDILHLARTEAGTQTVENEPFDLYDLLAATEAIVVPQAKEKRLQMSVYLAPSVPAGIVGARKSVQEVLINLLTNAIKFTETGFVRLTVDVQRDADDQARLHFAVTDTGMGVPKDEQDVIFESFVQSSANRRLDTGGAGLGLAICTRLVALMGGRIGVDSEPDAGSTFWFTVPLETAEQAARTPPAAVDSATQAFILAGLENTPAVQALLDRIKTTTCIASSVDQLLASVAAHQIGGGGRPLVLVPGSLSTDELDHLDGFFMHADQVIDPLALMVTSAEHGVPAGHGLAIAALLDAAGDDGEIERIHRLVASFTSSSTELDGGTDRTRSMSVLVAEDNRVNRQITGRILETLGHKPFFARDGEEVLDAVEDETFDLIFMDINMPIIDGLEATKLIRVSMGSDAHLPIIGLTADATPQAHKRCIEAGMDAVIHKPISVAMVRSILNDVMADEPLGTEDAAAQPSGDAGDAGDGTIVEHPQARSPHASILNPQKLDELRQLGGGSDFLGTIIREFVDDAEQVVAELADAANRASINDFRDLNHALRSSAANVGADRIFALCESTSGFTASDLRDQGGDFVRKLEHETGLLRREIDGGSPGQPATVMPHRSGQRAS